MGHEAHINAFTRSNGDPSPHNSNSFPSSCPVMIPPELSPHSSNKRGCLSLSLTLLAAHGEDLRRRPLPPLRRWRSACRPSLEGTGRKHLPRSPRLRRLLRLRWHPLFSTAAPASDASYPDLCCFFFLFASDHVFDPSYNNAMVYDLLIKSIIQAAVDGFNGEFGFLPCSA